MKKKGKKHRNYPRHFLQFLQKVSWKLLSSGRGIKQNTEQQQMNQFIKDPAQLRLDQKSNFQVGILTFLVGQPRRVINYERIRQILTGDVLWNLIPNKLIQKEEDEGSKIIIEEQNQNKKLFMEAYAELKQQIFQRFQADMNDHLQEFRNSHTKLRKEWKYIFEKIQEDMNELKQLKPFENKTKRIRKSKATSERRKC